MSRVLPIVSICLALLAFGVALMPRGEPTVPPSVVTEVDSNDEELDFLKRRVELLEDDNRTLWDRVVLLEKRPALIGDGGGASPAMEAEVARLRAELRSVMAGEVLTDPSSRDALKEVIREAQADQQKERFTQMEERRQKAAEQQKVRWKSFVTDARLTYAAEQKLNERLALEESERTKKMEQLRLGEQTWREVSDYLRTQRRETDSQMSALMDDTQKQQYQSVRREDGAGNGRMRGDGANTRGEGTGQRGNRRQQQ